MGAPLLVRKFPSYKRCDMCGKAFKQLYAPVQIGDFVYKIHSAGEVLQAQDNYNENMKNGVTPQRGVLTSNETDDTIDMQSDDTI